MAYWDRLASYQCERVRILHSSHEMVRSMAPKVVRRMNQRMERLLPTLAPRPAPSYIEADLRMAVTQTTPDVVNPRALRGVGR